MSKKVNLAVVASLVTLVCCGALILGQKVSAAGEGKITGTVKLDGTAPHMRGIDMSKDPYCVKANSGSPAHLQTVEVGSGNGLQNVVVYISEGYSGPANAITTEPVFDQRNCMYTPHVLPLDAGQTFKVTTSDQTAHNIHPLPNPMTNVGWNQSQPPGAPPVEKSWKNPEVIPVQCNIHPWMHGWFVVVKGPYGATDENGKYTINNVPPGNYTLTAWQETYNTQTQKVTVAAGGSATADFTFKAK
ncbi:MAG TPA: carboxypeptidase regulatory-like domain-containing protein [Candidatus Binatia bacterium]|nr:carboxypeptidase regulatory-like domain-containing protein [Candidatus Binatia bacterium]